ncbi:energy-coupling factor ABC transporter permease [Aestuariibacter salexigens]|uniref:energy-coupling factor ABC transporter permease n=1 Tax=Aestuariibacter salexigens TaxID=226010 RepID=UPI000478D9A1|nr:energy-coupling factor ABC transporter permease [Aestuariibacter salexigens]
MTLLQIVSLLLFGGLLTAVARQIDWHQFRVNKHTQHLVFGASASVFFLWLFRAGIYQGLDVHFLWLTALTLMLGFRMAVVSASLALLGITLVGKESLTMLGVNGLLGVLTPIGLSYLIYILSFHKLPRHFFVYIFVCAFFTGALMIALKMALLGSFYFLDGAHSWTVVQDNYLVLIPLMLFPEAMLNGMTMTLLVIYKPSWVYTFYDKHYLEKK